MLFSMPAHGLAEQRQERSRTIEERCAMAAACVENSGKSAVMWCHLNSEGDRLEKIIKDSVQVSGDDPDEVKEERFDAFASGQIRVLISKPKIAGFGLNWQHCHHQTFFPSHSFEQWYQSIRRSWRFGQKHAVTIDVVTSEGERGVLQNLQRKAAQAEEMFSHLVQLMNNELRIEKKEKPTTNEITPSWL
jgi:superfamily II DNA or RNA helicase